MMDLKRFFLALFVVLFGVNICFSAEERDITCEFNNGIYHIIIPAGTNIEFVSYEKLKTNKQVFDETKAKLVVNAGFFDPKNEKTISFIYNNGILLESPIENENLVFNETIMDNWTKVSNRTEFRVTSKGGLLQYDIAPHNKVYVGRLIASAQAGPMLLPDLQLEEEFFLVKDENGHVKRESASVLSKTARTLIGIKDGDVHIFVITTANPMNIFEARDLCKSYGLEKAMAFDGGSSTSLDYKDIHVTSIGIIGDDTGRKLKSFLIVR
jgi:exopolysaccharide biosynthesis protein